MITIVWLTLVISIVNMSLAYLHGDYHSAAAWGIAICAVVDSLCLRYAIEKSTR